MTETMLTMEYPQELEGVPLVAPPRKEKGRTHLMFHVAIAVVRRVHIYKEGACLRVYSAEVSFFP